MRNIKPIYLYLLFLAAILIARLFERSQPVLFYVLVVTAFVLLYFAVRNFFGKKGKSARRR